MNRLRGVKDLVRDAVEQGATAVERIHRSTAAKPFQVLRFIPALDAPLGVLQSLQDTTLAGTYGMVRWVNRAVDGTLDVALDLVEHHQRSRTNGGSAGLARQHPSPVNQSREDEGSVSRVSAR